MVAVVVTAGRSSGCLVGCLDGCCWLDSANIIIVGRTPGGSGSWQMFKEAIILG